MCKIMAFAGIQPDKVELVQEFLTHAAEALTSGVDRDGFGYAMCDSTGALAGERWLDTKKAFRERPEEGEEEKAFLDAVQGAFFGADGYNKFGDLGRLPSAVLLHARFKTQGVGITNTHPFVATNTAMVHNGVISNFRQLRMAQSDCDSESILNAYLDMLVPESPQAVQKVADQLVGSYACGFLGTLEDGTPYMDILKGQGTSLCAAKVTELGCVVFCTTMDLLEKACKPMHLTIEWCYWMRPGYLLRFNANTGEVISSTEFEPDAPTPPRKMPAWIGTSTHRAGEEDDLLTPEEMDSLYRKNGWTSGT